MRDLEAVAANIVEGDWAEKRTWVLRIALALRQARAEGAAEERERQARSEGKHTAAPDPNCEDCRGTGWVGDNGPGQRGNGEYVRCDCTADSRARAQEIERRKGGGE